jgi:hypothetical protein
MQIAGGRFVLMAMLTSAVTLLIGCGGGGGSGSATEGATAPITPTPPAATTSGLMPAPPALGTILLADATALRPVRDGAVWAYRGTRVPFVGAAAVNYVNNVRQVVSATAISEISDNAANQGVDTQPLSVEAGLVSSTQGIELARKGAPESIKFIELRSPVRAGDQIIIHDKRYTDTDIDADSDDKTDIFDVAVYARVIGTEVLALPNLPTLETVLVETTGLTRVIYSSNGQASPIAKRTVQSWYAKGLGIVRQVTSQPSANGESVSVTDEKLSSWDGVIEGFGALPTQTAAVPSTSPVLAGVSPGGFDQALAFDDHALLFSNNNVATDQFGSVVARVDLRGNITSVRILPNLRVSYFGSLVRTTAGAAYVQLQPNGNDTQLSMTQLDVDGNLQGAVDAVKFDLSGSRSFSPRILRFAAAADGSTMWVLWSRSYVDLGVGFKYEVLLRAFDLTGAPKTPEMKLDTQEASWLSLTAGKGQALASWARYGGGNDLLYAAASVSSAAKVKTLVAGLQNPGNPPTPMLLSDSGALVWTSSLSGQSTLVNVAGITLDSALAPLRSASSLDAEQIDGFTNTPDFDNNINRVRPVASGSRLVFTSKLSGPLWPQDSDGPSLAQLSWIDTNNQPLAVQKSKSLHYAWPNPVIQLVFADRVLLIGGSYQLQTTVLWLNAGSAL